MALEAKSRGYVSLVEALGWKVRFWPKFVPNWIARNVSFANPVNRTIYINLEVPSDSYWYLKTLAHEYEHALQTESSGAFWFAVKYLLLPWYRVKMEVRAKVLSNYKLEVPKEHLLRRLEEGNLGPRLSGFQLPYLTLTSKERVDYLFEEEIDNVYL